MEKRALGSLPPRAGTYQPVAEHSFGHGSRQRPLRHFRSGRDTRSAPLAAPLSDPRREPPMPHFHAEPTAAPGSTRDDRICLHSLSEPTAPSGSMAVPRIQPAVRERQGNRSTWLESSSEAEGSRAAQRLHFAGAAR